MCPALNDSTIPSYRLCYFISDTVENVCVTEVQLGATEQDAASDPLPGAEASSADQSHPGESVWEIEMLMEQQQLQGPAPAACPSMPSEDKESEEVGDRERGRDGGDEGTELGKSDQDSLQQVQPVPSAVQGQTFAEPQAPQVPQVPQVLQAPQAPQVPHVPQAPQVLQAPQVPSSCALPQNRSKLDDSQVGEWNRIQQYYYYTLLTTARGKIHLVTAAIDTQDINSINVIE